MKITNIVSTPLSIPLKWPFISGIVVNRANPVIVQLFTDEGLEGIGLAFTWNDQRVKSLLACIDDLKPTIVGQDVFRWAEAWQKLWQDTRWMGHQGYPVYALSAIDTALWDLRGKAAGLPVARLLGGYRDEVPAYASHLLFLNWSIDQLQKDAAALVAQGFRAMKMNMGDNPPGVDLERLRVVREAVGDDIDILVDVNWAWTVPHAIQMGREMEKYHVYWLEDPLPSNDPADWALVASALDLKIAGGETLTSKYDFRRVIEHKALDVLMPDLQRVGGVTEWMKVATMAQAWDLPVASHVFHEFSAHLVAAIPNGLTVEYMPWWDFLYQEPLPIKNGYIRIPDKPGFGLELNPEMVKKYAMK
ncbi:MAG: mandelate racemase/muconate lactonizing enzyme family protein [Chloroflexi bacterium]|nr:mandelate racemase/muconate lactonizing enzyme family protein [Chloroflexota bacterium]